jgi:GNAT superfamily N-acetyltransferase
MTYAVRRATVADIDTLVAHRELMFREMGWDADYGEMAHSYGRWLETVLPAGAYAGWVAVPDGETTIVSSGGLIVVPWTPGPHSMDPRLAWIVNVYTNAEHRQHGLARRLMEAMHAWCRSEGIERTALNASSAGQPIYESMGYTLADEPMMRYRVQ